VTVALYDINNNLIAKVVSDAILSPDIIQRKNRLLDGTYHTQTIGKRIDTAKIECYVDKINKTRIDDMYIIGEPIKLLKEDKYYIGLIENKPEWGTISKHLYITKFEIIISQSGVV